jgi:hypothetical protein
MNYYKELMKVWHPDLNGNSLFSNSICKTVNKLKNQPDKLQNLYLHLVPYEKFKGIQP